MTARLSLALLSAMGACGTPRGTDEGGDGDADADTDTDADSDAGADADGDADGDSDVDCEPAPGDDAVSGSCGEVVVSVLTGGAAPTVRVTGLLSAGGPGCAVVDEIVLGEDGRTVQALDGGARAVSLDGTAHTLAERDATGSVSSLCDQDGGRFEPFGVIVRGRVAGGRLEARCGRARADFGGSWQPEVVLTCHEGIEPPLPRTSNALVEVLTFQQTTSLHGDVYVLFPPGQDVVHIEGSARVIPSDADDPPLAPFDSTGWEAYVSEQDVPGTGRATQLSYLTANTDPFGEALCPVPPDPQALPVDFPPPFLMRLTGTTARGVLSTEVFFRECRRSVLQAPDD